jgi:cell shape-determining protein MreD
MGVIVALAAIVPLVTIFCFKNRKLQIRLCAVELVLLVGSVIFMAIYYYLGSRMFSQLEFSMQGFRIAIIFPVVSLILDYLALRAIFHDEMLVRSLDRIR